LTPFNALYLQIKLSIRLKSVPKYTHLRPVHLYPDTDLLPTKVNQAQKLLPLVSHIYTYLYLQGTIAPESIAMGEIPVKDLAPPWFFEGTILGGGPLGICDWD